MGVPINTYYIQWPYNTAIQCVFVYPERLHNFIHPTPYTGRWKILNEYVSTGYPFPFPPVLRGFFCF